MRRREFLQISGMGGVALGLAPLGLAPVWATQALVSGAEARAYYDLDGRWIDASLLPSGDSALSRGARISVLGFAEAASPRNVVVELGHPQARVLAWAHRAGGVPSTAPPSTQLLPVDRHRGLELFVAVAGLPHRVALQVHGGSGSKLRRGRYRIAADQTRIAFEVEEP